MQPIDVTDPQLPPMDVEARPTTHRPPRADSGLRLAMGLSLLCHGLIIAIGWSLIARPFIAANPAPPPVMLGQENATGGDEIPSYTPFEGITEVAAEVAPLQPMDLPGVDPVEATPLNPPPIEIPTVTSSELTPASVSPREIAEADAAMARLGIPTPDTLNAGYAAQVAAARTTALKERLAAPPAAAPAPVATGAYTPPRVAASTGRRGMRNGLDDRGLPIPEYPAESRRRREQGVVELDLEILADGTIGDVKVVSDPGFPRLVRAAINAAKAARFDPATLDGRPASGRVIVPFRFTLD